MKEFLQSLGKKILPTLFDLIFKTLRIRIYNSDSIENGNCVLMFWHGTMLAGWYVLKNKSSYGVVSQSKDGEILSRLLSKWGYKLIRGSSSKDSKEVMIQMVEALERGYYLAITPDGPRGPAFTMKIGGLISAVRAKKPIVLCGVYYINKIVLKSWDKFELPKPFSNVIILLSSPKLIPEGLTNDEYEKIRYLLENELREIQTNAATLAHSSYKESK